MDTITAQKVTPPQITSWDQFPDAFNFLIGKIVSLEQALAERGGSTTEPDRWFNLDEFCQYHPAKPAPTTVYGWVSRRAVPHKRDGKHLMFLKSEIDSWLKSKGRKTAAELETQAAQHISSGRAKSRVNA